MEQDLATLQVISDTLKQEQKASQRKLAEKAGMSLGLRNAILQRFVERGWIMLSNVNGRKLAYAVTLEEGMAELAERGKKFAARTFRIANDYNEKLLDIVKKAKCEGKTKVILYGDSYIKFIIKYACNEVGLEFEQKEAIAKVMTNEVCLAGELNDDAVQNMLIENGCFNLVDIFQTVVGGIGGN